MRNILFAEEDITKFGEDPLEQIDVPLRLDRSRIHGLTARRNVFASDNGLDATPTSESVKQ